MKRDVQSALLLFLALTLVTGLVYPLAVTAIAQVVFPGQASGSRVVSGERTVGSALLGQSFVQPGYFHGRPSATAPVPYNGSASSGSNLAATHPALRDAVASRIAALRAMDPGNETPVPVDLVTASGSGLDPDISPAAAHWQVQRVAHARGLPAATLDALVASHTTGRTLGILGEPRVNVLALNLALDTLATARRPD